MDSYEDERLLDYAESLQRGCKGWCISCTPNWWPKDAIYCYCKSPFVPGSIVQNLAAYEDSSWLYGKAQVPW